MEQEIQEMLKYFTERRNPSRHLPAQSSRYKH